MNGRAMRVLIADDRFQVRFALRVLLSQEPGVIVVGEAVSMDQVLELAAAQQPDVVLLDWELPGQNGTSALAGLRAVRPDLVVIALSGRPESCGAALKAGANAFVSKGYPPERLLEAVNGCLTRG